uniref:proline-rich protein 2-like n=1 Tax=Nyctereutes procyonoides TaxID=34880 RepID=UPI002444CED0|nr:proline-rich protein 2-like [Nyctereutes procyonoides]
MAARPPRPAAQGGARLTAPPPPASADWRPEPRRAAESRGGLARAGARWDGAPRPSPHPLRGPAPTGSPAGRAPAPPPAGLAAPSTPSRAPLALRPSLPHPQPVPPRGGPGGAPGRPPQPFVPRGPRPVGHDPWAARLLRAAGGGGARRARLRLCGAARICVLGVGLRSGSCAQIQAVAPGDPPRAQQGPLPSRRVRRPSREGLPGPGRSPRPPHPHKQKGDGSGGAIGRRALNSFPPPDARSPELPRPAWG